MTPQQLNAVIQRYREIISSPDQGQEAFLAGLEAVTAAWNQYTSVPATIYRLGVFTVRSGELIVVDAYGSTDQAVPVIAAQNGSWVAFIGAEAGTHVALFAYHESAAPTHPHTAHELIRQREWLQTGSVPIDTATCAIADRDTYKALDVEKTSYQIAGIDTNLCFSNSANADGSYPVFTAAQNGIVDGICVQFAHRVGE